MRSREGWVIDASVAAKWYLRDEDLLGEADRFAQLVQEGRALITAPHLSRHEVANTLASACRSGRTTREAAGRDLAAYIDMPVSLDSDPGWLLRDAMDQSARFEIAIYDAVYLALARSTGMRLVTADKKLRDLVRTDLPFVHYLGELELP